MSIIQINYYDYDNYCHYDREENINIDSMELYDIDEEVLIELNKFIDLGVCENNIYKALSEYISNPLISSREEACCYFIKKNGKEVEFSAENKFKTYVLLKFETIETIKQK